MKATFGLFLLLALFNISGTAAQELDPSLVPEVLETASHQERIFVHTNTSVIFPGEYFLYSIYNLNSTTGKLSDLSKIAYVELVGESGNLVFRQKVRLRKGKGNADYFIPTSVPSGNYKLLAYTTWMTNLKNNFFESDVILINPYRSSQKELLEGTDSLSSVKPKEQSRSKSVSGNSVVVLKLDKKNFNNRDQVTISLESKSSEAIDGTYSLSVRKIESLPFAGSKTATGLVLKEGGDNFPAGNYELKLPELRGQLLSGRITSEGAASMENKVIALSIPSKEGFAHIAATNRQGQFFFNLDPEIRTENAVLEVIGNGRNEFKIELDRIEAIDPSTLSFADFRLTPEMKDVILQRSIYNQVENAFFAVKPDTLAPPANNLPLPGSIVETYLLEDYTRFKTVPETFVEIIKSAWVRRNSSGEAVFQVRGLMNHVDMGLLPLVMVDGLLIQDHSIAANLDAHRVKSIEIIRDKIFLGPASFQGAVLIKTTNQDFFEQHRAPYIEIIDLFNPEIPKKYFQQVYTPDTRDNRIPDFRYQLLWTPDVELKSVGATVRFFTSDVDGEFEVVLEGFTAEGIPVSLRDTFTVE